MDHLYEGSNVTKKIKQSLFFKWHKNQTTNIKFHVVSFVR